MERFEIIDKIGSSFYSSNLENGEFSYSKGLKSIGKSISDYRNSNSKKKHNYLDIRFENDRLAILVETKNRLDNWDKTEIQQQLQEYVKYEKVYSDRKIVAILAETEGNNVWTWYGQSVIIDDEHMATNLSTILSLVKSLIEVFFLFSIYVLNEGVRQLEENDDTWKPFIIKNETTDDKEFLTIYTPAYETDVTVKEVYDTILAKTKNIYEEIVEDFRKSAIKKMQSEIQ